MNRADMYEALLGAKDLLPPGLRGIRMVGGVWVPRPFKDEVARRGEVARVADVYYLVAESLKVASDAQFRALLPRAAFLVEVVRRMGELRVIAGSHMFMADLVNFEYAEPLPPYDGVPAVAIHRFLVFLRTKGIHNPVMCQLCLARRQHLPCPRLNAVDVPELLIPGVRQMAIVEPPTTDLPPAKRRGVAGDSDVGAGQ